jgi:hypothetical protein
MAWVAVIYLYKIFRQIFAFVFTFKLDENVFANHSIPLKCWRMASMSKVAQIIDQDLVTYLGFFQSGH